MINNFNDIYKKRKKDIDKFHEALFSLVQKNMPAHIRNKPESVQEEMTMEVYIYIVEFIAAGRVDENQNPASYIMGQIRYQFKNENDKYKRRIVSQNNYAEYFTMIYQDHTNQNKTEGKNE